MYLIWGINDSTKCYVYHVMYKIINIFRLIEINYGFETKIFDVKYMHKHYWAVKQPNLIYILPTGSIRTTLHQVYWTAFSRRNYRVF